MITYLCLPALAFSQHKYDYVWTMGYADFQFPHFGGTKLDFNYNEPVRSTFDLPHNFAFGMPCSIADGEGNLQFYAMGCKIINHEHEVMDNGGD